MAGFWGHLAYCWGQCICDHAQLQRSVATICWPPPGRANCLFLFSHFDIGAVTILSPAVVNELQSQFHGTQVLFASLIDTFRTLRASSKSITSLNAKSLLIANSSNAPKLHLLRTPVMITLGAKTTRMVSYARLQASDVSSSRRSLKSGNRLTRQCSLK